MESYITAKEAFYESLWNNIDIHIRMDIEMAIQAGQFQCINPGYTGDYPEYNMYKDLERFGYTVKPNDNGDYVISWKSWPENLY